jgi:hypothetical protein
MSEGLFKDIEKIKVRLEQVEKRQRETSEKISGFLADARKLAVSLSNREDKPKISRKKLKVMASFEKVMEAIGGFEHEKSHLMESIGKLLQHVEVESQAVDS